jgi:hypothetical protein
LAVRLADRLSEVCWEEFWGEVPAADATKIDEDLAKPAIDPASSPALPPLALWSGP